MSADDIAHLEGIRERARRGQLLCADGYWLLLELNVALERLDIKDSMIESLARRCADQSELLGKLAERDS